MESHTRFQLGFAQCLVSNSSSSSSWDVLREERRERFLYSAENKFHAVQIIMSQLDTMLYRLFPE